MAASGVGQFSINVKSNLKDFYGELNKSYKTMKELTDRKHKLEVDSRQLDSLRDKSQRIAAEMKELRQQKTEIKLGTREVDNAEQEIENINKKISSLNRQKLTVEADIQPIRTANTELYKVNGEIDRINSKKIDINVSESIKQVGSTVSSMGDGILKAFNPLTSKLNQMFGFGLINSLADKAVNLISGSVDGAISRMDTLNNFEKVMSNMNIGSEDANKSKNTLIEGLDGLPTALDAGVSAVQRFTSKNKDIQKSTDLFLAVNNALLAGGTSADTQSQALEQLSQAYSKGKFEMDEWKTLTNAMPAQIDQVAQSFGKSSSELYESLKDGSTSMDKFMDRIIQLNTEGANGFKSFSEQARNAVGGVETGISRMKSAVTRGITSILTSIDEMAKARGLGGISDILYNIGKAFENGMNNVAKFIAENQDTIFSFFEKIGNFLTNIDYAGFFNGLGSGLSGLWKDAKAVFNIFKPLFNLLGSDGTAEGIGKLIPRIFELGIALKAAGTATKLFGGFTSIVGKISEFKLPSFNIFGGSGETPMKNVGVEDLKGLGLKMLTVAGIAGNIYLAAKALQQVNEVGDLNKIGSKMASIAVAVSGMSAIVIALDKISTKLGANMLAGIGSVIGIAAGVAAMAVALQQVDKINNNFGQIQVKIAQIALVIGEMSIVIGILGALTASGIGTAIVAAGFSAVVAISAGLVIAANAIREVDKKVPKNIKSVLKKIQSIGEVLKEMSGLAIGSWWTALMNAGKALNVKALSSVAKNIIKVTESLQKLSDMEIDLDESKIAELIVSLEAFMFILTRNQDFVSLIDKAANIWVKGKQYDSLNDVVTNLKNISEKLQEISRENYDIDGETVANLIVQIEAFLLILNRGENFVSLVDKLANVWVKGNIYTDLVGILDNIKAIADKMNGMANAGLEIDSEYFKKPIDEIEKLITFLKGKDDFWDNLTMVLNLWSKNKKYTEFMEFLDSTKILGEKLTEMSDSSVDIDIANIKNIIESVEIINSALQETFADFSGDNSGTNQAFADNMSSMKDSIFALSGIATSAQAINGIELNVDSLDNTLKGIKKVVKLLSSKSFTSEDLITSEKMTDIKSAIDTLIDIPSKFSGFTLPDNIDEISTNMEKLVEVLKKLQFDEDFTKGVLSVDDIGNVNNTVDLIVGMVGKLQQLSGDLNIGMIGDNINEIKTKLGMLGFKDKEFLDNLLKENEVNKINRTVDLFINLIARLAELNQPIDLSMINTNVYNMKSAIFAMSFLDEDNEKLSNLLDEDQVNRINKTVEMFSNLLATLPQLNASLNLPDFAENINDLKTKIGMLSFGDKSFLEGYLKEGEFEKINSGIGWLIQIRDNLNNFGSTGMNNDAITANVTIIKNAITSISDLAKDSILENLNGISEALSTLISNLTTAFPPQFADLGTLLATNLNDAFNKKLNFSKAVDEKLKAISTGEATSAGDRLAKALNDTFSNRLNLTDVITKSIQNALNKEYTAKVKVETTSTNSRSTSTASSSFIGPRQNNSASGGLISNGDPYSQLVDSPERPLLMNGEYVIPEPVVKAVGVPLLDSLRNGVVSRTLKNMGQSISRTTSTVYNNYNNYDSRDQSVNVYPQVVPDLVAITNRRLR
ncbi:tape measure protein [Enterococcus alishanensis]